jgi:hypothetical protein
MISSQLRILLLQSIVGTLARSDITTLLLHQLFKLISDVLAVAVFKCPGFFIGVVPSRSRAAE